jgi:hypothetical protein
MEKVKGIPLKEFIVKLYSKYVYKKNNTKKLKIISINKNKLLFKIFLKIAKMLEYLQEKACFVHGDFHWMNIMLLHDNFDSIFITLNEIDVTDETLNDIITHISIKLIDFGYSIIKLPYYENCILVSYSNYKVQKDITELDMIKNPIIKGIDLYYLIAFIAKEIEYNNGIFNNNNNSNSDNGNNSYSPFRIFFDFINIINLLLCNKLTNSNLLSYIRSKEFPILQILYPENFIKLNYEMIMQKYLSLSMKK